MNVSSKDIEKVSETTAQHLITIQVGLHSLLNVLPLLKTLPFQYSIHFRFQSIFFLPFSCKWRTKATTLPRWHHWPLWTLHPLPLLPSPPPPPSKPIIWPPALHQASFSSLEANLHYWDELSYCVDSTAWLLQERAGLSLDMGIMQWPGFRGQFTHCLKSISRNISLVDCLFCSAEAPLRPSQSISVQIYLHTSTTSQNHNWYLACCYTAEFIAGSFHFQFPLHFLTDTCFFFFFRFFFFFLLLLYVICFIQFDLI